SMGGVHVRLTSTVVTHNFQFANKSLPLALNTCYAPLVNGPVQRASLEGLQARGCLRAKLSAQKKKQFSETDRHIADAKVLIARRPRVRARTPAMGYPSEPAESTLAALERTLHMSPSLFSMCSSDEPPSINSRKINPAILAN